MIPMPLKAKVSYSSAAQQGMTQMAETAAIAQPRPSPGDHLSTAIRQALDRQRVNTGSAPRLQPAYIGKLEAEGVIQRLGNGFQLDQSRVAYLRYLRRERQQSPRSEADAAHVGVKTEMLQLRLMEKKRELVRRADVDELIDQIAGTVLKHLSSLPARCAPRGDLAIRRSIERVVFEVRPEIANVCQQMVSIGVGLGPPIGVQRVPL